MWGAIVVLAGLAVVVAAFFGALSHYPDSKDVVAVVGAVTGLVGTIVTAFFGIHATANAASDATRKVAAARALSLVSLTVWVAFSPAAAAYIPASQAAEFVDKLGIRPH